MLEQVWLIGLRASPERLLNISKRPNYANNKAVAVCALNNPLILREITVRITQRKNADRVK